MLIKDGIPDAKELQAVLPSESRLAKGPVAVYECFQEIPCDHCMRICPNQAVKVEDLHGIPVLDEDKCIGCGICVGLCPGQAVFTVDITYSDDFALVRFPFEYLPLPEQGQFACALDRAGKELGWYEIGEVSPVDENSRTRVIGIKVPRDMAMEVRNIKAGGYR